MTRRRLFAVAAALLAVLAGVGAYAVLHEGERGTEKRGNANVEFDRRAEPRPARPRPTTPWPTYGFDAQRSHLAPYGHRPPFRKVWRFNARDTIEFPPSVGFGRVYVAQQRGAFYALDAKTGRLRWKRNFKRCAASSPTLADGVVYQAYMDYLNCPQGRSGAGGFLIAMDAATGRRKWIFRAAPIESSPLLVRRTLYVGSWDHRVYAIDARTGRKRWSFEADDQVNTSAAYWRGRIYIASDGGKLYSLDARTGRLRWSKDAGSEFFYATPTVAYGRVFIGNTDGTMYAYGARSGRLLWGKRLGSYIYSAAGVYRRRVYTGTYDGYAYALDAATGDVRWRRSMPAAVHAAPTIMGGVVYFAGCSTCGQAAARAVKNGPESTVGFGAISGRTVWRLNQGKYANPVVADSKRMYLTARAHVFAFAPRKPSGRR